MRNRNVYLALTVLLGKYWYEMMESLSPCHTWANRGSECELNKYTVPVKERAYLGDAASAFR